MIHKTGNPSGTLNWRRGGSFAGLGSPNIFGTMWNSPIHVFTAGQQRAIFTTGNALNSVVGNTGDGLRIVNPTPNVNTGHLDMFTSNINGGNETHIVWGSSGYNISFV